MKKLNLGCGKIIKKGWVNVDIQKGDGIDKSFDFDKFPYPFQTSAFDFVLADNVFEHLNDIPKVLDELHRISKGNAQIEIIVPYYHCKGAFNDASHKHFFNETTFDILINPERHYSTNAKKKFELVEQTLVPTRFGRLFPRFIRRKASYVLGEIYSEIRLVLKVLK